MQCGHIVKTSRHAIKPDSVKPVSRMGRGGGEEWFQGNHKAWSRKGKEGAEGNFHGQSDWKRDGARCAPLP